mmetsp:Transcript_2124/g.4910  ORF Transcript_2124/g.4910 Transcript_2124/m.4910 type:complete len:339 (+) Transcript_2124:886-1902(+)
MLSSTCGRQSGLTALHIFAAVRTATLWTPDWKKSMNERHATTPPDLRHAPAFSRSLLIFSRHCKLCSARSMYSTAKSFPHNKGTAPCLTMDAHDGGIRSARCVRARAASKATSGLCSTASRFTRAGTNASTLNVIKASSEETERVSHSSVRDSSCLPSSPSALSPERIVFMRECPKEDIGRRSSNPAPSFRSRPCRARSEKRDMLPLPWSSWSSWSSEGKLPLRPSPLPPLSDGPDSAWSLFFFFLSDALSSCCCSGFILEALSSLRGLLLAFALSLSLNRNLDFCTPKRPGLTGAFRDLFLPCAWTGLWIGDSSCAGDGRLLPFLSKGLRPPASWWW